MRRCHRALAFVEMPALQVLRDDIGERLIRCTAKFLACSIDAGGLAGSRSVAPIKDRALENVDRINQPIRAHVLDERGEVRTLDKREDVSEWVKRKRHA